MESVVFEKRKRFRGREKPNHTAKDGLKMFIETLGAICRKSG